MKLFWIGILLTVLAIVAMKDAVRFNGHALGCYCDTCCYDGYVAPVNPDGVDYAGKRE